MFHQVLDPLSSITGDTLLALVPVVLLLTLLAVFRMAAWQVVIIGSAATILIGTFAWKAPAVATFKAYGLGAATGFWSIDWIVFWGVVIYNTLVVTGAFDTFRRWLITQATADVRVQALLMAWAFGALLEGLVGFGYPWAIVAPILVTLGVAELAALRVSALANSAPVSFGALGAPIIGLAAVTNLPLMDLSASIGKIVAILALAPPWLLIYLVSGRRGFRDGWPLAIVASLGYIAGQFPIAEWVGPYLPDVVGSATAFIALLTLLRFWRPRTVLGFGGVPVEDAAAPAGERVSPGRVFMAILPFLILIAIVVAWTGPWSSLSKNEPFKPAVTAISSLSGKTVKAAWEFSPFVAGTAILASWIVILIVLRVRPAQLRRVFGETFRQTWGALLVGPIIYGLAYVFNFTGMASSMANGFSKVGTVFVILAPILGWIGVALSGSNTSTNAVFGAFQVSVARLLGAPILLFPSLNSVGAEVGKPVAPQTASVGVSTSKYVRNEGPVIRNNFGWTLILLVYLIAIGLLFYYLIPGAMRL